MAQMALSGRKDPLDRLDPKGLPERMARFTMAAADGLFVAAQAEGGDDLDVLAELLAESLVAAAVRLG